MWTYNVYLLHNKSNTVVCPWTVGGASYLCIQWIVKRSDSKTKSSPTYSSIDIHTMCHVDIL